jgi:hypothetical protein
MKTLFFALALFGTMTLVYDPSATAGSYLHSNIFNNHTGATVGVTKTEPISQTKRVTIQPVFGNASGALDIYASLDGTNRVLLKTYSSFQTGLYDVPATTTANEIIMVWRSKEAAHPYKPFNAHIQTSTN